MTKITEIKLLMPGVDMQNVNEKELKKEIVKRFSNEMAISPFEIVKGNYPPLMPDSMEVHKLFAGKTWRSLDDGFFISNGAIQTSLNFMTVKAFFYYLPAMMLFILGDAYTVNDACLLDGILERTCPADELNYHADFYDFLENLPADEYFSIKKFIFLVNSDRKRFHLI